MSRTRFNILHKYSIVVNEMRYKVCQSKENTVCKKCDCFHKENCLLSTTTSCISTIGRYGYLKRINPKK